MNVSRIAVLCAAVLVFSSAPAPAEEKAASKSDRMQKVFSSEKTKIELYTMIKLFYIDQFMGDTHFLIDDKELGVLTFIKASSFPLIKGTIGQARFWIRVEVKDKKVRVTIDNLKGYWWCQLNGGFWTDLSNANDPASLPVIAKYPDEYRGAYTNAVATLFHELEMLLASPPVPW
jgi:hypothetical protein